MAILKIARMGHPVLLRRAEPVADPAAPEIQRLIADLRETMEDAGGVGLAAPQVHVPLRLFVYRLPPLPGEQGEAPRQGVVINPEITPVGEEEALAWEGCLSIPGLRGVVPRPARIRYRGWDASGVAFEREAEGFEARVVQHETDHLDGILYPMRMRDFRYFAFEQELARFGAELLA